LNFMSEQPVRYRISPNHGSATPELDALLSGVIGKFAGAVAGVLMYGSCLRTGDLYDGLVDLYVVLDDYRYADSTAMAIANRLIPPNVFYLELEHHGRKLRSKYSVISLPQLEKRVSRRCFEAYFWGRFCQPVGIVFARNETDRKRLEEVLRQARDSFISKTLALAPGSGTVEGYWIKTLAVSYSSELRAEGPGRARQIVAANRGFYIAALLEWASGNRSEITVLEGEPLRYQHRLGKPLRGCARLAWALRKVWGKLMSLIRLTKAMFTFDGGLDYIAWKLERHSGQRVEIPERVRERPLLRVWGLAWRLYRRGVFK
jgi:hypothetical protein